MPIATLWNWWTKDPVEADVVVRTAPETVVVVRRRISNRSKRVYVEAWKDAAVIVNGERV